MKNGQLAALRSFSLLLLLPGLAGMIVSAMISTHYLDTLPQSPAPDEMRMTPRNIHGVDVYQTVEEDRKLSLIEDSSVGVFLVGLCLGLVYLEKWGSARAHASEQDEELTDTPG
jgi:hypothetical protein